MVSVPTSFLRLGSVMAASGHKRSALYAAIDNGLWPRGVKFSGARAVAWPSNEVAAINAARLAGRSDADVRALVRQLEASRKAGAQIMLAVARAPLFQPTDHNLEPHRHAVDFIPPPEDALWHEGAEYVEAWLSRYQAGKNQPGELQTLLTSLGDGVMFSAACRTLERAIGGQR